MPEHKMSEIMKDLKVSDLKLDTKGRVVITKPGIAERLPDLDVEGIDPEKLAGNGICCGNTNCLSPQLVGLLDKLAAPKG